MVKLLVAKSMVDLKIAIQLFKEYAKQIPTDLSFQNFENELLEITSQYSAPNGQIVIAYNKLEKPIGCFGVRKYSDSICELKRIYLKKEYRGKGIGQKLLEMAIEIGRELKFDKMRLDTLPSMEVAINLYIKLGFYEIHSYRFNPIKGAKFFEIKL